MKALKLFSLLSNQRGFTLTEVMVGGGILAGVALASAQLFKDQKSAQKKVEHDQKLALFHAGLVKTMNLSSNCNATFKGNSLADQPIPGNQSLNALYKCSTAGGTAVCNDNNAGASVTNRATLNQKASSVTVDGTPLIAVNSYTDNTNVWMVNRIYHTSASTKTTSGPITLKVEYQLKPNNGTPGKTVAKDIVINARFYGGVFQECLSGQESSINNLQNDFCKSINYQGIDTTGTAQKNGQFAKWDEATQTCILGTDKDCSSIPGMMVDGVDSMGNVKCRSMQTNTDASFIQDGAASDVQCTGGQTPTLKMQSGKMRIVCQ